MTTFVTLNILMPYCTFNVHTKCSYYVIVLDFLCGKLNTCLKKVWNDKGTVVFFQQLINSESFVAMTPLPGSSNSRRPKFCVKISVQSFMTFTEEKTFFISSGIWWSTQALEGHILIESCKINILMPLPYQYNGYRQIFNIATNSTVISSNLVNSAKCKNIGWWTFPLWRNCLLRNDQSR